MLSEEEYDTIRAKADTKFYDCKDKDEELLMAVSMIDAAFENIIRNHGKQKLYELQTLIMMRYIENER